MSIHDYLNKKLLKEAVEQVLYGTKKGRPDYEEEIISTNPKIFDKAKKWAEENGFDRIRIAKYDLSKKPDFTNIFNKKR